MVLSFHAWMTWVDEICQEKYGVSVHDLSDCPFRDWYDDDMRPATAARKARYAQD
jgi:hypothetical protein